MIRQRSILLATLVCLHAWSSALHPLQADESEDFFEARIRPVLISSCIGCHGPARASGGLRLDSRAGLLKGGDSGSPVNLEEPAESLLLAAIARQADVAAMPPDRNQALRADQVADFTRWVREGLHWPEQSGPLSSKSHWAFEPHRPGNRPAPTFSNPGSDESRTWIDDYLDQRMAQGGFTPGPAAPPDVWLRRLAFDLTGLPPSRELVVEFLADPSPAARVRVVESLLASPAYGEHWGRQWLDVVRYADTAGETADYPVPLAWRYRNRVVEVFNRDEPWDQFLRDQIAGDLPESRPHPEATAGLAPGDTPAGRSAQRLVSTGFLALSRRFGFDSENYHHLTIQDSIDTVGQAVLGLSWGCARCHDHKFDPVSMRDYYGLYGILASSRYPFPGSEQKQKVRTLAPLVPAEEAVARWNGHLRTLAAVAGPLQARQRPLPPLLLRPLTDLDGDFELQAPAAGGSNGVLVPPWQFTGPVAVTTGAQSPFRNRYPLGGRVGASVAAGAAPYSIDQVLPPALRWSGRDRARFSCDLRLSAPAPQQTGSHRLRIGPQVGPALVELQISSQRISLVEPQTAEGQELVPLFDLAPQEWFQVRIDFDGEQQTFALAITQGQSERSLPPRPWPRPASATGERLTAERITWGPGSETEAERPALDLDQVALDSGTLLDAIQSDGPNTTLPPELADLADLNRQLRAELGNDGDLELQREAQPPAAPWNPGPSSLVKLATAAQSPFVNVYPKGHLGLALPSRAEYDGFGWQIPGIEVAASPTWYASFEFRPGAAPEGLPGSWRYYLGHGAGPTPGVELHFTASQLFVPGETEAKPVARLQPGEWHQVQLTIDPVARRYRGVVYRGEERQEFTAELSKKWDGQFDYSFIDSYGHQPGVRPALEVDNFQLTTQRLPAPTDAAAAPAEGETDARRQRIANLRERVREAEVAWGRWEADLLQRVTDGPYPLAYAMGEGTPHAEAIQLRGEPTQPGAVVPRGLPTLWGGGPLPEELGESGRRELAEWLTSPRNPLTARVFVNRIWQRHFGRGLVKTPNDFGVRGQPPTHPELLDALAQQFVAEGWSVKWLHRQIVLSAAWGRAARTSAEGPATLEQLDSYQQFPRRRLSAEELRDALLQVTGELNATPGEGHPFPPPSQWGFTQHQPFQAVYDHPRRSLYLMTQRLKRHPYLALFDGADPNASTPIRSETVVPTQALFFLNDPLVHELSLRWANRLAATHAELPQRLEQALWSAYGRPPAASEIAEGLEFVAAYRLAQAEAAPASNPADQSAATPANAARLANEAAAVAAWLRTLLASNEFVYLD